MRSRFTRPHFSPRKIPFGSVRRPIGRVTPHILRPDALLHHRPRARPIEAAPQCKARRGQLVQRGRPIKKSGECENHREHMLFALPFRGALRTAVSSVIYITSMVGLRWHLLLFSCGGCPSRANSSQI